MRFMSDGMPDACSEALRMKIHYEIEETAVSVIADEKYLQTAKDAIFEARSIIKKKISDDPFFRTTFEPISPSDKDDPLIRRMCQASVLAGVGPMAGVAGAVAVFAVERMKEAGAPFAVIENGGDIALFVDTNVTVGVFSGEEVLKDTAFDVPKRDGIFGICSSSGKIGPSVSFGRSGICTVFSDDVILADCCATALGNMIKEGTSEELSKASEAIGSIDGVDGCLVSCNGLVAMFGDVPELIRARVDEDGITKVNY